MFICLDESEAALVFKEVYEGVCESHIIGRVLGNKLLRVGHY